LIKNGFHEGKLRLAIGQFGPRDNVADNEYIWLKGQLLFAKPSISSMPKARNVIAHGRVYGCVAACDCVACLAGQRSQTAHKRAANT